MGTLKQLGHAIVCDRRLLRLSLIAVLIRLVIVVASTGSNDVFIWDGVARTVRELGLMGAYEAIFEANHPPLAILYMAAAHAVAEALGLPFAWLVKLPALVGDVVIAALLWHVIATHHGRDHARRVTVAYLFNPVTILLAAFHGNTDVLYVALLFAAALALDKHRHIAAGILLGGSLNVKLIPLATCAAFVVVLWRRSGLLPFAVGLGVMMAPIWLVLAVHPRVGFVRMLAYQHPVPEPWGLTGLEVALSGGTWYFSNGRVVLAVALLAAAAVAYRQALDGVRAIGLSAVVFLCFAPRFGVQYLALPVPFLFATYPHLGRLYGLVGGATLVVAYAGTLLPTPPLTSAFSDRLGTDVALLAAVAWGVCAAAAIHLAWPRDRGRRPGTRPRLSSSPEVTRGR